MDELVQFLRARLDEDEQTARRAGGAWADGPAANWVTAASSGDASEPAHRVALVVADGERAHIVRHDPARVLRDIEAKRDLLRVAERAHDYHETFTSGFASALEGVLRLFAVAYAEHPDYRTERRP
jgi:hypothetical protein